MQIQRFPPSTLPLKDLIQIRIRNPQFAKGLRFSTGLLGGGWGAISPIGSRELARCMGALGTTAALPVGLPPAPGAAGKQGEFFPVWSPPSLIDTQCMFVARMNLLKYRVS